MNKKNVIWWRYCFKTDIFDIHIEYNTYYKQSDMNMSKFINYFTKFINSFKWNHTSIWLENTVLFFPYFLILASRQFLNMAGWILFYATIHVYTVSFLWNLCLHLLNFVMLKTKFDTNTFIYNLLICQIFGASGK